MEPAARCQWRCNTTVVPVFASSIQSCWLIRAYNRPRRQGLPTFGCDIDDWMMATKMARCFVVSRYTNLREGTRMFFRLKPAIVYDSSSRERGTNTYYYDIITGINEYTNILFSRHVFCLSSAQFKLLRKSRRGINDTHNTHTPAVIKNTP
jgi:hypothetical protein